MAKIIIPTPLRKFTDNQSSFDTSGGTIKEALTELVEVHKGLRQHLLDSDEKIRSFIRIYLGEEDIESLENENTFVESNSVISIVPAIAGGC